MLILMGDHRCVHFNVKSRGWSFNGNVQVYSFYWKQKVCSVDTKTVPMKGLYDDFGFNGQLLGNDIVKDVAYY